VSLLINDRVEVRPSHPAPLPTPSTIMRAFMQWRSQKFSQGVRNAVANCLQYSTNALHCFWTIAVIV